MDKASKLKEAGNKAFAAGNIQAALGAYSFSLETLEKATKKKAEEVKTEDVSTSTVGQRLRAEVLCNRALCLGKLGEHQESLADATAAIASDASFAKGHLRHAQALLALKCPAKAVTAAKIAEKLEPVKLAKQVKKLMKKCQKMLAPAKKTTHVTGIKSQEQQLAPTADVHTFATTLVTAALSCGIADPAKSKFEGSHLILSMMKDGSEKRLHVANLFKKYEREKTLAGRARCLMNIVRQEIVGFAILPHSFEIAKHLLRPRLFSRQKLDASGSTAMPAEDNLPCWMLADGSITSSSQIQQADAIAVAVVVDYGKDGMLPVMTSTFKAWNVSFDEIRKASMANFRHKCKTEDSTSASKATRTQKSNTSGTKATWKPHMSGCLTSPWTDNTDGARVALCPELYVPAFPLMEGQQPRAPGTPVETVAIFGTNNCVLISEPSNPISQCFVGDIVMNDMESTIDHVSSLPHRLVKGKTKDVPWAWRPYYPNVQRMEFSVPSSQSEIDSVLEAVQSGGKKQIPVFGATESTKQGVRKNIEALLSMTEMKMKNQNDSGSATKSTCMTETKLKTGFLGDGTKSVLKDKRISAATAKKKQKENDAKSVAGLDRLNQGFFNTNTDILVETATKFDGPREGCVFRLGSDGLGYYKDVPNKSFKTAKPVVAKAAPAATIDVATLNRSIGMYGSGMSNFSTNSLFEKKKSLFSL